MAPAIPGLPVRPDPTASLAAPARASPEASTAGSGLLHSMRTPIERFQAPTAAARPPDRRAGPAIPGKAEIESRGLRAYPNHTRPLYVATAVGWRVGLKAKPA